MRWTIPQDGDIKIEKKFAVLPIEINHEVRWLERVVVKSQFFDNKYIRDTATGKFAKITGWMPLEFIDN